MRAQQARDTAELRTVIQDVVPNFAACDAARLSCACRFAKYCPQGSPPAPSWYARYARYVRYTKFSRYTAHIQYMTGDDQLRVNRHSMQDVLLYLIRFYTRL
jgi:hypothetical protein